jgi:hypothetical protein
LVQLTEQIIEFAQAEQLLVRTKKAAFIWGKGERHHEHTIHHWRGLRCGGYYRCNASCRAC